MQARTHTHLHTHTERERERQRTLPTTMSVLETPFDIHVQTHTHACKHAHTHTHLHTHTHTHTHTERETEDLTHHNVCFRDPIRYTCQLRIPNTHTCMQAPIPTLCIPAKNTHSKGSRTQPIMSALMPRSGLPVICSRATLFLDSSYSF